MDHLLTLKQLADHLQVSERTIFRLLERGELPGVKVGGHWRFRRGVVDYWLDLRIARMGGLELLEGGGQTGQPRPVLSEALAPENSLIQVPAGSRREVVERFIGAVTFPEGLDAAVVLGRVWARETLASTALTEGVALLHTSRWEARTLARGDFFAIGRLDRPVDFGAVDGLPTDLLFLLLTRSTQRHHVLLARATRLCRQDGFLAVLRAAPSPAAVVDLIRRAEHLSLDRPVEPGNR